MSRRATEKGATHSVSVRPEQLDAAVQALFLAAGSKEDEARLVAAQLVGANLAGHDSHGVGMVPRYVEVLGLGELHLNRRPEAVVDSGAIVVLDAGMGLGQVAGQVAMEVAIERARRHGIALVGLRNSHHLGRIGHWAEQCAAGGVVSLHFVNVISEPMVAAHGGRDARLVTNPIAIGVPMIAAGAEAGGDQAAAASPLVLDFATSRWAVGKVRVALNKGEALPPGVLLATDGTPAIDPAALFARPGGALLPFGEHKGSGLALMCELLGAALIGGPAMHGQATTRRIVNNMLTIAIDPGQVDPAGGLAAQARAVVDWVHASPPAEAGLPVMVAGEPERRARAARRDGIPIDAQTWQQLHAAADAVGLGAQAWDRIAEPQRA